MGSNKYLSEIGNMVIDVAIIYPFERILYEHKYWGKSNEPVRLAPMSKYLS